MQTSKDTYKGTGTDTDIDTDAQTKSWSSGCDDTSNGREHTKIKHNNVSVCTRTCKSLAQVVYARATNSGIVWEPYRTLVGLVFLKHQAILQHFVEEFVRERNFKGLRQGIPKPGRLLVR